MKITVTALPDALLVQVLLQVIVYDTHLVSYSVSTEAMTSAFTSTPWGPNDHHYRHVSELRSRPQT